MYFGAKSFRTGLEPVRWYPFRTADREPRFAPLAPVRAGAMTALDDRLLFEGCADADGCNVWESDGTAAGTRRLANVRPGRYPSDRFPSAPDPSITDSSAPRLFVRSGSRVFLPASGDDASGTELWAVPLDALGRCDNGSLEPGEACDTAGESATCDADCSPTACGDGRVNVTGGEECDPGDDADGGCCTDKCVAQPSGFPCGTADVCDGDDVCGEGGVCHVGAPLECGDDNPVTIDWCAATIGCVNVSFCAGDCSADGRVSIDELLRMIGASLDELPVDTCVAGDTDRNGQITIAEIVAAIENALQGCGPPPGSP